MNPKKIIGHIQLQTSAGLQKQLRTSSGDPDLYIVTAILTEIVFHVDESSWSSIKFTSPLNVIVTPHVPGASSDFTIFGLPFNMVNTSTFLSLKTIKLHNKKWKRPETMKRVRHELFFIKKNRYLQLGVKTCCLHNQKEKN